MSAQSAAAPETRAVLGVTRSASGRAWADRLGEGRAVVARAIAQRHGLPDVVARVLAGRDVAVDDAPAYLDPSLRTLMPDPSGLTDMDAAAARLADAVERGEKVAIFGDYDVDGATSSALLARFLRGCGLEPAVYIPDRLIDGYGPNPRAVADLAAAGATLLVTLDCGTHSFEAFDAARRAGLDVVALDHHQAGVALPKVAALVNPNRHDDLSGQGHLAAVGVTYLGVVALNRELRRRGWYRRRGEKEPDLLALLDLVALGTVCDVVPLVGLNRAFVVRGLAVMRARRNPGLAALADVVRLSGPPTCYHLGFLIGPRINAGGRIGDAALGARLLAGDDALAAARIAAELDRLNRERQLLEAAALEEADAMATPQLLERDPAVLVVASADWHPGIVGLVAARLKERHGRPAVAIALGEGGQGTGSCRSIPGVDIGAAVRAAIDAGLLVKGGGHAMAAGLTIDASRVGDLAAFLDDAVRNAVAVSRADDALLVDGAVTAGGATVELVERIERAGPFGSGSPDPVFVLPAHRIAYAETVGAAHVRLSLAGTDGTKLKAMAFRAAGRPLGDFLLGARDRPVHVAGVLGLDHWQGEPRVQLRVVDAAPAGPDAPRRLPNGG
ncbi:single-stranded-DNA-specific exonuclease RecJ [Oharaeibacter diazotrophicus]|uniref:Single-stranded-DNA-specific exonuclease RecJ n=3 Tax=Oharaeibacter diazotrophicus TaxID=1920512 RepID=A0A4R6RIY1_9HYPH|nr:single-stranded-DNA-specific exonuclease RecJ [Oharaeibacter diazotrophicus]TDP86453.1 single-stranded-DNA-specific exonuclease [Oharaeibacter diazotrophicus]BBE71605.1 single-stranded-DNA-specific exonuclease RecJ [Pleomorphomonas sp. SM30]GLS78367.1 single-stranded-DNA-specific exonuclease [Oharaeibacter diazotrophicus]